MASSSRKIAVNILLNIEKDGAYSNIEMNRLRNEGLCSDNDIRLIGEMVNGVIKRKITLDYVIAKYSSVKVKKIAPYVLNVLRLGAYQLLYMDKIPPSAAVDESVKLIKKSSVSRLSGFVNAILRKISKDDISALPSGSPEELSAKYSYPLDVCTRWCEQFGTTVASEIMDSLNQKSPLYIRVNSRYIDIDSFEEKLKESQLSYEKFYTHKFPSYSYSFKIDKVKDIKLIPGFLEGAFYIQDPSAALAAYVLEAKKGDRVLDMCAAPGGKSLFIAELMDDIGEVISCDIYEHKLKLIEDNAKKYKLQSVKPTYNDATNLREEWIEAFDRVLCDVPCSGYGIIRKKPDIKYSHNDQDIKNLSKMGLDILEKGAMYLKKGGVLVYSTCTIEKEENENVIEEFLEKHSEFSIYPLGEETDFPKGYYTSYPNLTGTDGFFICRLRK